MSSSAANIANGNLEHQLLKHYVKDGQLQQREILPPAVSCFSLCEKSDFKVKSEKKK